MATSCNCGLRKEARSSSQIKKSDQEARLHLLLAEEREAWKLSLGIAGGLVRVEVEEAEAPVGVLGRVVDHTVDHTADELTELGDELVLGHALGDVTNVEPAVLQLDVHLKEGGQGQEAGDGTMKARR